jgi:hypothetical protein
VPPAGAPSPTARPSVDSRPEPVTFDQQNPYN